jgi:D-methionine transport system ATP-binding protein
VFGDPQHEVSKTLLAPLQHGLPDDLQARLHAHAQQPDSALVLDLQFSGADNSEPDLSALFSAFGGKVSLLHGGVERIQGRALGHLVLAIAHSPLSPEELLTRARKLAQHAKVLGYVV